MLALARTFSVLSALLVPLAVNASPIQYIITGLLPGVEPLAINNSGVIAGEIFIGGATQAFVEQPGGPIVGIGTRPEGLYDVGSSQSNAINSSGQVAGTLTSSSSPVSCGGANCGFIYNNGVIQTFSEGYAALAYSINDSGVVAGSALTLSNTITAYTYSNGQFQNLGTLPGDTGSRAYGINDSGQVVGASYNNLGAVQAFLYSNGVMQDLGTLPGDIYSYAYGINNLGQVIGVSYGGAGGPSDIRAFIYNPATGLLTALGNPPGDSSPEFQRPEGINDSGEIVGSDGLPSGAFLYTDGSMYSLQDLVVNGDGWILGNATGINDAGEIIGSGSFDGVAEGFILTLETPEPDARMLCLALAIAGVHQLRLRKRAAA